MNMQVNPLVLLFLLLLIAGCTNYSRSQICGTHNETYTSTALGCDKIPDCSCLHNQYLGIGSCDSCLCTRQVSNC